MAALADDVEALTRGISHAVNEKRYGRAICAMTPRSRFVHDMLCEYFDHPAMRGANGSGMTVIARLMKFGPTGAAQHGPTVPLELPSRLLLVGDAIKHLNERMRNAVRMTYGGNYPVESIARELHCSHAVARALMKNARPLIGAFLAGHGVRLPDEK
jgi:hypothetical protein